MKKIMSTPWAYRSLQQSVSLVLLAACVVWFVPARFSLADDWPMWRYDAGRTAASPIQLPAELELLWQRTGTPRVQAWDDPLNLDLMTYDRVFEPIILDGNLYIGHSDSDKLLALDAESGTELWSFYADAPIRLPLCGWQGRVYFTSDDGLLYCLDASSGQLEWKFDGIPGGRKVIGNRRLTSAWPARGGVVVRDEKLYFAASIWPFMGVFIYALDAETGAVAWVNDSAGSTYIKQPHSAPSFAGIGPQGALVATDKELIVPGGRSVPAVLDRATGELKYFELNAGGKGTGGSFVAADDSVFFVHTRGKGTREFNLKKGTKTAFMPNEPVLHQGWAYSAEIDSSGQPLVRGYDQQRRLAWESQADGRGDLILAGSHLYAVGPEGLFAIELPSLEDDDTHLVAESEKKEKPRQIASRRILHLPATMQIERLLAGAGKLFAVSLAGDVIAFGAPSSGQKMTVYDVAADQQPLDIKDNVLATVNELFQAGDSDSYALWYGAEAGDLIKTAAAVSPFVQLAIVDPDQQQVDSLRRRIDLAGRYGSVTAHAAAPLEFDASPYIAKVVVVSRLQADAIVSDHASLRRIYESVRPYGGVLQLLTRPESRQAIAAEIRGADLEQAQITLTSWGVSVARVGALPGSANWTHLHGDIGNTRKSNDARVKLPLGVLWFGGSSNMDVLPRHGHGPPQQVVDGRLFIQGIDKLSARDVYTGRVLWIREFEDLGTYDVYYDETYKETPLDPSYNQVHIPGANARGTNFVVTPEFIYVVVGDHCELLDPGSGNTVRKIELPQADPQVPNEWSYIGVYDDVLIGGVGFAKYRERLELDFQEQDKKLSKNKRGFGSKALDRAGSLALAGFDRLTGELLWKVDARHSFWNNAVAAGNGKLFCLDKNPRVVEDSLKRRGIGNPDDYRLLAFDIRSGETAWEIEEGIFGTWLGYSEQHDLLLQAGAAASDRLSVEVDRGMTVYRGADGSVKWSQPDLRYSGPCIIHNELIISNANSYKESAGAFYLHSGEPYLLVNPLTGVKEPWKITRAYGCNTILASENLLTFRSGAAGFYDLTNHSGTGNFGGFKSGCTGNLIVANGVLNAPDYTRTCSCAYQNQTSLALVHMPDLETWTVNTLAQSAAKGLRARSLGINFGAPGQQRSPSGTLWVESPPVASSEVAFQTKVADQMTVFRRHSSAVDSEHYPWVLASGVQGEGDLLIETVVGGESRKSSEEKEIETKATFSVRLFFADPSISTISGAVDDPPQPIRRFEVWIDDQQVIPELKLGAGEHVLEHLPAIELGPVFRLQLVAIEGTPVISGLELKQIGNAPVTD